MEEDKMKKYDCTKTLDYSHETNRMCTTYANCKECVFKGIGCIPSSITQESIDIIQRWSDEHPEAPKLTKREHDFLDCFHPMNKYIKRQYGVLSMIWNDPTITMNPMEIPIDVTMFKFVEKGQKWSFDNLLKLEVEE